MKTFPAIEPLHTDPRWQAAHERLNTLRTRLEAIERRQRGAIVPNSTDAVARLLADPTADLAPPEDPARVQAEQRTLREAIEGAEREIERVRNEVSAERLAVLHSGKAALADDLVAVLTRAVELIDAEVSLNRRLNASGYRWEPVLPRLAFPTDLDAVTRLRDRIAQEHQAWTRAHAEIMQTRGAI